MGFLDRLKRLFSKKPAIESLQSLQSSDSIASIAKESNEDFDRKEALFVSTTGSESNQRLFLPKPENKQEMSVQKDSFKLGLAAGYTGKSIVEIERALGRIE